MARPRLPAVPLLVELLAVPLLAELPAVPLPVALLLEVERPVLGPEPEQGPHQLEPGPPTLPTAVKYELAPMDRAPTFTTPGVAWMSITG